MLLRGGLIWVYNLASMSVISKVACVLILGHSVCYRFISFHYFPLCDGLPFGKVSALLNACQSFGVIICSTLCIGVLSFRPYFLRSCPITLLCDLVFGMLTIAPPLIASHNIDYKQHHNICRQLLYQKNNQ